MDFDELNRWYTATGHAHASLLRWYRTVGYARHGGVSVDMYAPPAIDGDDIEYLGGHTGKIDGRDMTLDEVTQARELLAKMWQNAKDGLEGNCTIDVIINDKGRPEAAMTLVECQRLDVGSVILRYRRAKGG